MRGRRPATAVLAVLLLAPCFRPAVEVEMSTGVRDAAYYSCAYVMLKRDLVAGTAP